MTFYIDDATASALREPAFNSTLVPIKVSVNGEEAFECHGYITGLRLSIGPGKCWEVDFKLINKGGDNG